jgi:hypothetical protein
MPEYTQGAVQVLPEGDYKFVVDDAGEKESKQGNAMIELQLLVYPDPTKPGIRVFDQLVFVESAYWKIDAFRVCTGEKLSEGQKVSFEADDCIDRQGWVHLIVDSYDGRTRNKVGEYLAPTVANTAPAVAAPKQGGGVGAAPGGAVPGATAPAAAVAVPAGGGGSGEPDDIPFASNRG